MSRCLGDNFGSTSSYLSLLEVEFDGLFLILDSRHKAESRGWVFEH